MNQTENNNNNNNEAVEVPMMDVTVNYDWLGMCLTVQGINNGDLKPNENVLIVEAELSPEDRMLKFTTVIESQSVN